MHESQNYKALVFRWAPIHYQSVGSANPRADLLAAIDYDRSWNMQQKWENLNMYPLIPHVYYSVVETTTHWYILYAFYHVRDWHAWWIPYFQHENDLEGCLMIIEKRSKYRHGYFLGMITASHDQFWLYTFDRRLKRKERHRNGKLVRELDGQILCTKLEDVFHPSTYQDPYGHGLWAWDGGPFRGEYLEYHNTVTRFLAKLSFVSEGKQGVRYYPADEGREPAPPYRAPIGQMDVPYKLTPIFGDDGIWGRRNDGSIYASTGAFLGSHPLLAEKNKANPPWQWRDKYMQEDFPSGILAVNPAKAAYTLFQGFSQEFDLSYVSNQYLLEESPSEASSCQDTEESQALDFGGQEADQAFRGPHNPPINLASS